MRLVRFSAWLDQIYLLIKYKLLEIQQKLTKRKEQSRFKLIRMQDQEKGRTAKTTFKVAKQKSMRNNVKPEHLSPRLQYSKPKQTDGLVVNESDTSGEFRRTQPNFGNSTKGSVTSAAAVAALANASNQIRVETPNSPKHASPRRSNLNQQESQKPNLLNKIAEPQERRPYYLHQQQPRRFRNTASSFVSEQTHSSKPDSLHNMVALGSANNIKGQGNDDLADVSLSKKRSNGGKESKTSNKHRWQHASYSTSRNIPHITNLAQAYTKGVESLIQTLPFQLISRVQPVQTGAYRMNNQSPNQNPEMLRRSQYSSESLHESISMSAAAHGTANPLDIASNSVRKSIQLGSTLQKENSQQLSGNLISHTSLHGPAMHPLSNIKSSVFQDSSGDYEFLSRNRLITEYQSQNQLNYFTQSPKANVSARYQNNFSPPTLMSQPVGVKLAEIGIKTHRQHKRQLQQHHQAITSTERNIQAILERADYHKLRRHRDPNCPMSEGTDVKTCTCDDHITYRESVSKSFDYSNMRSGAGQVSPGRLRKANQRNVLSIQLRPLKGRAAMMQEYKSMIQQEYGKEKKKQIYETMYSPFQGRYWPGATQMNTSQAFQNIRLNLRPEVQIAKTSPIRKRDVVKLRTIAPGGQIREQVVQLDQDSADRMNTTMRSSYYQTQTDYGNTVDSRKQTAMRFDKHVPDPAPKQFYLFSAQNMQNSRYKDMSKDTSEVSIMNLHIESGEVDKSKISPGSKLKTGYAGLSELRNLQADSRKDIRRDDGSLESNTEIVSQHQLVPVGKGLSRLTKGSSKMSSNTKLKKSPNQEILEQPLQIQSIGYAEMNNQGVQATSQRKNVQFQLKGNTPTRVKHSNQSKERTKKSSVKRNEAKATKTQIVSSKRKQSKDDHNIRELEKKMMKLNENSTMNVTIQSDLNSSYLQLPGTRQQDDNKNNELTSMMKDFSKHINNAETPDLTQSAAYLDERIAKIRSSENFDVLAPPSATDDGGGTTDGTVNAGTDTDFPRPAVPSNLQKSANMRYRTTNALEQQILRQQRHIEQKIEHKLKKDEHLGVLQRKPVQIKKQSNHKRVSQISIIDEFYREDDKESTKMQMAMRHTMPYGGFNNEIHIQGLRE